MCKLSVSSLRKGGFTAFEAEVLNYVATNNITTSPFAPYVGQINAII